MPLKIKGRLYLLMGSSSILLAGLMISSNYKMMSSVQYSYKSNSVIDEQCLWMSLMEAC